MSHDGFLLVFGDSCLQLEQETSRERAEADKRQFATTPSPTESARHRMRLSIGGALFLLKRHAVIIQLITVFAT